MSAIQKKFFNNAWAIAEFEKLPLDSVSDILNLVMSYKIDKLRREFCTKYAILHVNNCGFKGLNIILGVHKYIHGGPLPHVTLAL